MNTGKKFEQDFKKSAPEYCFVYRLTDNAQSYGKTALRFSLKNPCDYFVFDTRCGKLYALELKSTKNKSISFENIEDNKCNRMIHAHQIESLKEIGKYNNIYSGFVLNFRDEKNNCQSSCYFDIYDFLNLYANIGKWSFTLDDAMKYGAKKISGVPKKTHYKWDYEDFLI